MTSSAGADAQPLIVVSEGHRVGRIRFNRPAKLNPLSSAMLLELSAALKGFGERGDIHSVVIEGTGRAFSAGFDLSGTNRPDTLGGWNRAGVRQLRRLPGHPVVADPNDRLGAGRLRGRGRSTWPPAAT